MSLPAISFIRSLSIHSKESEIYRAVPVRARTDFAAAAATVSK